MQQTQTHTHDKKLYLTKKIGQFKVNLNLEKKKKFTYLFIY